MKNPNFFIGPMSKNVVDTIIEFCNRTNTHIGLIPSRRQIEHTKGYVNNWSTKDFVEYVRSKTDKILLVRDHSGPSQGEFEDDGLESLSVDCKYLDVIHIDPWKRYQDLDSGIEKTIELINYCHSINNEIEFEIGTEESIRKFEPQEIEYLIVQLQKRLSLKTYKQIKYLVIQSGTSLKETNQTGNYSSTRLESMIEIVKKYNLISKEHNGDYITVEKIYDKFKIGLDSINIAPEFGVIETNTYLNEINEEDFLEFYKICYESKKWVKWVNEGFDPENNKKELVKICGHYILSTEEFVDKIKNKIPNIDQKVRENINKKLEQLIFFDKNIYS